MTNGRMDTQTQVSIGIPVDSKTEEDRKSPFYSFSHFLLEQYYVSVSDSVYSIIIWHSINRIKVGGF